MANEAHKSIPITVFTGFLGAGKTSIILSLLSRLPADYKVVLLKNEFGDVQVDSQLAKQSSLAAVSEILNGCMCCVLVGQMKTALLEIRENFRPDRIIIECSGSAFPATLAFQIRELERETEADLKLDAILTVIDAENFTGYEDTSPTARMQASYTDMIIINKWEHVSERQLDILVDHLNTLNDLTPKIKCEDRNGVDPALIFGLDSKLYLKKDELTLDASHHNEVQAVTFIATSTPNSTLITEGALSTALGKLSKEAVWRVKGFVRTQEGVRILNWAFGRYELTQSSNTELLFEQETVKLTVMGERGEVKREARKLAEALDATLS
ncbi:uncharacterized protein PHACADRAFT_90465 [Phanerochaete carnosa HHB-10118-sp]|uniref:CobW/HypB/UreG nucleotide-binding domain-containing protein n=1 Tax=Phanerochaete carnosa (strain HHB-10118-sp) TaxID=650164 RepID=K5WEZ0_PHACS|nr:uncharacterized protein PHACADRAFT_90465 [Phanerochaete carnosa HHB-10118-sp]EKM57820.1 hypothetical protein PHACADRAFT_90465 [Phanerochaete carnosa HHB-10118-sp]